MEVAGSDKIYVSIDFNLRHTSSRKLPSYNTLIAKQAIRVCNKKDEDGDKNLNHVYFLF